ncbi:MAG: hypothetical protein KDG50_10130 [Chromatiales bacterium]|nr:hypothetical protein [Chromatiales bacterium]
MKRSLTFLGAGLLSFGAYASEGALCVSLDGKPLHCQAGDIIVVRGNEMPVACDFNAQIVVDSRGEDDVAFICRYIGALRQVRSSPQGAGTGQGNASPQRGGGMNPMRMMPFMGR